MLPVSSMAPAVSAYQERTETPLADKVTASPAHPIPCVTTGFGIEQFILVRKTEVPVGTEVSPTAQTDCTCHSYKVDAARPVSTKEVCAVVSVIHVLSPEALYPTTKPAAGDDDAQERRTDVSVTSVLEVLNGG